MAIYVSPDFDPKLVPARKAPAGGQIPTRIMLPMSVQCIHCHTFVYKGKKFNGKKEEIKGGDSLGIKVYRFYFKCPHCLREISFVTDPQHSNYRVESGALRLFEPWRQEAAASQVVKESEEKEGKSMDPMRALEKRTAVSRAEVDRLDSLEFLHEQRVARDTLVPTPTADEKQAQEDAEVHSFLEAQRRHRRLRVAKHKMTVSLADGSFSTLLTSPTLLPVQYIAKRKPCDESSTHKRHKIG